jgi:hypothetical protein
MQATTGARPQHQQPPQQQHNAVHTAKADGNANPHEAASGAQAAWVGPRPGFAWVSCASSVLHTLVVAGVALLLHTAR